MTTDDRLGWGAIDIAVLRDIGWEHWDPIGLLDDDGDWRDEPGFADEYDTYLMQAAARLWRGDSDADVVEYLVGIESEHIGLGIGPDTRPRAVAVVAQIRAYVDSVLHPTVQ